MSNFKIGDVVRLKSGGPNMTVDEIMDDNFVICIWFNPKQEKLRQKFHQDQLEKYLPPRIEKGILFA